MSVEDSRDNYHPRCDMQTSFCSGGKGTGKRDFQRDTRSSWQGKLIVHEDVMDEELVINAGKLHDLKKTN